MRAALIGHTGFVGSTLDRSGMAFDARYNSRNIDDIRGERFDLVICAGVSAVKWKANAEPEADWAGIRRLIDPLTQVEAERFVLISTVDVYPDPVGVTEDDRPSEDEGQPYGRHRLMLENRMAERFERCCVVRLPALFGPGLKKNAIYDLLTGNMLDKVSPNGAFQWYPVRRLSEDLERVMATDAALVNIAVEPVSTGAIVERFFPSATIAPPDAPGGRYDMRTRHAGVLGGTGDYHLDAEQVMAEIGDYAAWVRANGGTP